MMQTDLIGNCTGFDWDEGNFLKNWEKHSVTASECEQIFFNHPLVTVTDKKHSEKESRFYVLGHTDSGRLLFLVFTVRGTLIRVISARDMSRKERKAYESYEEKNT
ncbi:MAG: BrnT family toxin [Pseudomonadota bacterium]